MLSPEVLKQIRGLELKAGHLVTEALAGNYVSAFKGRGMEFDEVREYVPGDDVRSIDWNVTARMRQPFVKVLREEREQTLMLMVDVSPSQMFGTTGRKKQEMAAELAAVLAFLAIRNNDKVGLVVFSDHVEQFIPPKKGRSHVFRIISTVLTHKGTGKTTNIHQALAYTMQMLNRRSLMFVISDFWAEGFESQLKMAARRHELVCVRTLDPVESRLPDAGFVALRDLETGEDVLIDSSDPEVVEKFSQMMITRDQDLRSFFRRNRMGSFMLETGTKVTVPLIAYLRERDSRRRR